MQKKMFICLLFIILGISKVNASCSLEEQVTVNNAAGAVNVVSDKLKYTYSTYDPEHDETFDVDDYTGIIYVYNLTPDIYFNITDGKNKETYTYADDINGAVAVSTGTMAVVKNYTIAIYSTNKSCGTTPVRTISTVIPRYNNFSGYTSCQEYPDYYYCQQFLNSDLISETEFQKGLDEYAKTHKKSDESRRENFIESTMQFIKKYWLYILIALVIVASSILIYKKYLEEKRKKEIV